MKNQQQIFRAIIESLENRRLLSSGALDTSFSGDGFATFPAGGGRSFAAAATAVQTDGKVVVVGTTSDHEIGVVRFNIDGTSDLKFGTGGAVAFHFSSGHDVATSLAIQKDGKIIVAGAEFNEDTSATPGPGNSAGPSQVAAARLTTAGVLDNTFGNANGIFTAGFTSGLHEASPAIATHVVLTAIGQAILTGTIREHQLLNEIHDNFNILALRLTLNGKLDKTYDSDGTQILDMDGGGNNDGDYAYGAAIDENGTAKTNPNFNKLIIVGATYTESYDQSVMAIARLNPNGSTDDSFHGNGTLRLSFRSGYKHATARSVVITTGEQIVVTSEVFTGQPADNNDFGLVGLTSNGSVDGNFGDSGTTLTNLAGPNDTPTSIIIGQTGDFFVGGTSGGHAAIAAYTPTGRLDTAFGTGGKVTPAVPGIRGLATQRTGTVVATGGANFSTARYFDIEPTDSIGSLDSSAAEQGAATATFLVTQSIRLPYDRKIYLSITGSATNATVTTVKFHTADYSLSGIVQPALLSQGTTPYVVIPANSTFALVTLTPIDDTRVEGDETAIFSIVHNPAYDTDKTLFSTTLTIHDNDAAARAFNATADAYVQDGASAGTNFGSSTNLIVKQSSTVGLNRQSYLTFDLSSLASVTSVKLQVYGKLSNTNQTNIATQVFAVFDPWSETAVNYNNKPANSRTAIGAVTVIDATLQLYTLDVTAYVKAQLAAGHKIVSFVIKASVTSDAAVIFSSRESSNGPQLIVT
jgi:uncharacterized delta-60 repeat protein